MSWLLRGFGRYHDRHYTIADAAGMGARLCSQTGAVVPQLRTVWQPDHESDTTWLPNIPSWHQRCYVAVTGCKRQKHLAWWRDDVYVDCPEVIVHGSIGTCDGISRNVVGTSQCRLQWTNKSIAGCWVSCVCCLQDQLSKMKCAYDLLMDQKPVGVGATDQFHC